MREHLKAVTSDALAMRPSPPRIMVAMRAALAVGSPLVVIAALGRTDLGLYVVFGAFAAVYGGTIAYRGRWKHQLGVGLLLCGATISGAVVALFDERGWLSIPVAAVWGMIGARLSDRQRWVPPGPLFPIFAAAACAAAPTEPRDIPVAVLVVVATMLWAVLLGALEETVRGTAREEHHGRSPLPLDPSRFRMHVIRVGVVVVIAGAGATLLGLGHPYWAMVAAVAPLSMPRLRAQVGRGVQRSLGTFGGVLIAGLLLYAGLSVWATVAVAIILQTATELVVTRNYGLAMLFITPLALLMVQWGHPEPVGQIVLARLLETLLGVTVGITAAWVTRAGRDTGDPWTKLRATLRRRFTRDTRSYPQPGD